MTGNTPKDEEEELIIIRKIKAFVANNPGTVTFVCGVVVGIVLVWVL